jgi:cytoskeletal protein RodZ
MTANMNKAQIQRVIKFLGDAFREARENQSLTLPTAAKLSGMDVRALKRFEAGRLDLTLSNVVL